MSDLPDYMGEIFRSKNIWGYVPDYGEEFLWPIIICTESPGAYNFTRAGLAAGEEVELVDPFTGLEGITPDAGWDYLLKEVWINFDQPVRWKMVQDVYDDVSCEAYIPSFSPGYIQGLPIGWTRAQAEPIAASTKTTFKIKNLGSMTAYGKAWIVGFMKEGLYEWY